MDTFLQQNIMFMEDRFVSLSVRASVTLFFPWLVLLGSALSSESWDRLKEWRHCGNPHPRLKISIPIFNIWTPKSYPVVNVMKLYGGNLEWYVGTNKVSDWHMDTALLLTFYIIFCISNINCLLPVHNRFCLFI